MSVVLAWTPVLATVGGLVASVLDEVRVESRLGPHGVVGVTPEFSFTRGLVLTVPRAIDDVVCSPEELGNGVLKEICVAAGRVKVDGDSATDPL
jgi:hypothetical protein